MGSVIAMVFLHFREGMRNISNIVMLIKLGDENFVSPPPQNYGRRFKDNITGVFDLGR